MKEKKEETQAGSTCVCTGVGGVGECGRKVGALDGGSPMSRVNFKKFSKSG